MTAPFDAEHGLPGPDEVSADFLVLAYGKGDDISYSSLYQWQAGE